MDAERWSRIEQLSHGANDLAPVEHDAYLTEACAGDGELRAEVEALLSRNSDWRPKSSGIRGMVWVLR
jgi:serine/threonine-protein kinase